MSCFIGIKPYLRKHLPIGCAQVFEIVDEGNIDKQGSEAEVEGDFGIVQIKFFFGDSDQFFRGFLGENSMRQKALFRKRPKQIIDIEEASVIFDKKEKVFFFQEMKMRSFDNAVNFILCCSDLEEDGTH